MAGLIHIYTGDGKGKTTAATGLSVRAKGRGKRVLFVQFLKDGNSGEVAMLRQMGIEVRGLEKVGFVWNMTEAEKQQTMELQNQMMQTVCNECEKELWDVVILDEIMAAMQTGLLDEALADKLITGKPENLELVLTGRSAPQKWMDIAHYVTEMKAVKHPFDVNISAREGIEY